MQRSVVLKLVAIVACAVGVGRIVATYPVFNATYDEPFHLASGLEWLSRGTYEYEWQHPPLARIAIALGPWADGLRSLGSKSGWEEGPRLLGGGEAHLHMLALARLGNLPFFVLACWMIWLWARRWFNEEVAAWAVVFFASLPAVLGHAGLATLDLGCAATLLTAGYLLLRWWEAPGMRAAALAGGGLALALGTKFSSLPFLAVAFVPYVVLGWRRPRPKEMGVMALVAIALLWALYRFHLIAGVPLVEFVGGLATVAAHNRDGQDSYLFGEYRRFGWWYFFPVTLAVKMPEAFLVLALAGTAWLFRQKPVGAQRFTLLAPWAILVFSMTARMNMGVRHVLPVVPFLAMLAAMAVVSLPRLRVAAWLLALTVMVEPWLSHPDYLAYFNPSSRGQAERILAESDLDWGQDLFRLARRLKEKKVQHVAIRYFGTVPLEAAGLPAYTVMEPDKPVTGTVAVSARWLTLENAKSGAFEWLKAYRPVERIGRSIHLYEIPAR